jgi:hypothetical protein
LNGLALGLDESGRVALEGGQGPGGAGGLVAANVIPAEALDEGPGAQGRLPALAQAQANEGGEG